MFQNTLRSLAYTAALAFAVFTSSPSLNAQSTQGGVRGSVIDPLKAGIGNAKVTLVNDATGESKSALTHENGGYDFPAIPPATYALIAENPSFKKFERKNVVVGTQEIFDGRSEAGCGVGLRERSGDRRRCR